MNPPIIHKGPRTPKRLKPAPELEPEEKTQLTISDDRTDQHEISKRNLLALHEKPEEEATGVTAFEKDTIQSTARIRMVEQQHRFAREARETQKLEQILSQGTRTPGLKQTRSPLPSIARNTSQGLFDQSSWGSIRRPASSDRTAWSNQIQFEREDDRLCTKEVQALREQMSLLEAKLSQYESTGSPPSPSRFQYLYRLRQVARDDDGNDEYDDEVETTRVFSDPPEIVYDQNGSGHLRCSLPLRDLDLFLARHQDISFIIFRDYDRKFEPDFSSPGDMLQVPDPLSESVYPVSSYLKEALKVLFDEAPSFQDIESRYEFTGEILAPYHFLYHSREKLDDLRSNQLTQSEKDHLDLLLMYVEQNFGDEYDTVDSLLKQEKITAAYIDYLFKPGEVIIEARDQDYIGYVANSWIIEESIEFNSEKVPRSPEMPSQTFNQPKQTANERPETRIKRQKQKSKHSSPAVSKTLKAWTLNFDGSFSRSFDILTMKARHGKSARGVNESGEPSTCRGIGDEAQPISSLNVFPLKYASDTVREILKRRGNTFWKCREKRLVSYHGERSDRGVDTVR